MKGERDLVLLADGIAKLEDELAEAGERHDRTEIEALLELARETYTVVKARMENPPRRPRARVSRQPHYLQQT